MQLLSKIGRISRSKSTCVVEGDGSFDSRARIFSSLNCARDRPTSEGFAGGKYGSSGVFSTKAVDAAVGGVGDMSVVWSGSAIVSDRTMPCGVLA